MPGWLLDTGEQRDAVQHITGQIVEQAREKQRSRSKGVRHVSVLWLQVSRTTLHLVRHRVARSSYGPPSVLSVACDVVPHVLKRDALFALQNRLSSVAYVDMERMYGYGRVDLRKPCTVTGKVLRYALVTVQRHANVEGRKIGAFAWLTAEDVDPRV